MKLFGVLFAALCLAALPAIGSAQALSTEAEIFRAVCLNNAPAFDEAAVRSSAGSVTYSGGDILASGGVEVEPGRRCKVAFRIAGIPSDADVQSLAVAFAGRVGGTVQQRRSAIGGDVWYEVRVGRQKYGVEGGSVYSARYFTVARR